MICSTVLASLVIFNAPSEPHALTFGPAEELCLEKTFSSRVTMESNDFRVFMGGQPVPSQFLPKVEIQSETGMDVTLSDTYGPTKDGQLGYFQRTYGDLKGTGNWFVVVPPEEPEGSEWDNDSDLSGDSVAFTWDEQGDTFEPVYLGEGQPPVPLNQLRGQLDLLGLLPPGEVPEKGSWVVDGEPLSTLMLELLRPGGNLGLDAIPEERGGEFHPVRFGGSLKVALDDIREKGGVTLAILTIKGECERVEERQGNLDQVPVADGEATDTGTWNYEIEGEMIWNMTAGHAVSLRLDGDFTHELRTEKNPGQPGADYVSEFDSIGQVEISVKFADVTESDS